MALLVYMCQNISVTDIDFDRICRLMFSTPFRLSGDLLEPNYVSMATDRHSIMCNVVIRDRLI